MLVLVSERRVLQIMKRNESEENREFIFIDKGPINGPTVTILDFETIYKNLSKIRIVMKQCLKILLKIGFDLENLVKERFVDD